MISQSPGLGFRLQSYKSGLRLEDCGTPQDDKCRVFKEMVLHDLPYQHLSMDEIPIGWTCRAAHPGDYLIAEYLLGEVTEAPDIPCLVVREDQGSRFRIIGHAIVNRQIYPLGKPPWFTIRFDIEDYITIVAIRSSKIIGDAISAELSKLLDSPPTRTRYSSFAEW
jgi:hypothetical protein